METFIPIIIAIVVFAFQAYANYQKEQDKARKRNPAQPPLPEDNAKQLRDITRQMTPAPVPAGTSMPTPSPAVRPEFEHYSGVMGHEESPRGARRRPLIPQRLAVETATDVRPALDAEEFDLRDAVIKSIILDRPYK
ncbi:hypothetical protein [Parapedobacter sp. 10938]|uniref:hypothetical protein n=1 Tax=Parapedobacter flavus TaxID=3110225 RepID=UPI002DBA289B|nr:hypothetical protein [Parapedobacter sp. 10938]MEC3878272.1 hypothetical protein [Parapedobacter sp. 10938]